jgi:hypothetical protein
MTNTPWGKSQTATKIATGIMFYTTVSHGGIHLTKKRQEEFKAVLPHYVPFLNHEWLEEDCDAPMCKKVWPQFFSS